MANENDPKTSSKLSAADGSHSSNQDYCKGDEGWFASFVRRFVSKFSKRSSSSVDNNDDSRIRQIPGKHRIDIFDLYSFKKNGMSFFSDKILKYNSRVFKSMLGSLSLNTIICDVDAICESCCDASKVFKEPVFGGKMVNLSIIGNHLPCMFTNDFLHAKRKAFHMGLSDRVATLYLLPALVELIPNHMKGWNDSGGIFCSDRSKTSISFEDKILKLVAAIYSKAFLGIVIDYECMKIWHKSIFNTSRDRQLAMEAYNSVYIAIKECPMLEEIHNIGVKYELTEKEMINGVLFVLLFNAIPNTVSAMTSAIGRCASQDMETRRVFRNEAAIFMHNGVQMSSLARLNNLENFILEVIRLSPPVPFVFGTARSTFVLCSSSGNFTINEGHMLAGNLYEAHRDPEWFSDPKQFHPSRFTDDCMLKDCILSFGGRYTDDAKSGNRKCPGQDVAMIILKTFLSFFLQCDFSLETPAIFEDKNLGRSGLPDEPLLLETFKFHQPSWWRFSEQGHDVINICPRDMLNSRLSFCTEGSMTRNSSITIYYGGTSSFEGDESSCVQHIFPQNLLHPGYQGSRRSHHHSEGTNTNSSLSMVDVDMM